MCRHILTPAMLVMVSDLFPLSPVELKEIRDGEEYRMDFYSDKQINRKEFEEFYLDMTMNHWRYREYESQDRYGEVNKLTSIMRRMSNTVDSTKQDDQEDIYLIIRKED